jgi:Uma2 family endonuclease
MENIITNINQLDFSKKYSYADYLKWQFEDRVELIKGWIYKVSPAPSRKHQKIEGVIFANIWNHFRNKNCEVYNSPFDVRLTKNKGQTDLETETVVQPDIVVVCNTSILDDRGCKGAPDLVVEVLSQSTLKKDFNEKFNLYEENQIKEYWLVHPELQTVETYILKEHKYELNLRFEKAEGVITSPQFADFSLDCREVFKD